MSYHSLNINIYNKNIFMRTFIKKLLREYYEDDYNDFGYGGDDLDYSSLSDKNSENKIKNTLKALPNVVTLYRIISADDERTIDTINIGSHYSMDKKNLISTHHFLKNKKYFMLTVEANKPLIDVKQTIANNLAFPLEKEITLKNKGKGAKIVDIKPF